MTNSMWKAALCAGVSLVCLPSIASAQSGSQPDPKPTTGLEEIIVTAQRREERLQDVPVSVTAFGAKELERRQITDVRALTENAPSITFTA
ncbi:MAG TPA: hypothetical protein PLH31_20695 [Caulobacter sp.]|nr:hypothetical protein [Caulobacter sp.]